MPLHFTVMFLYYTDTASLASLLLLYYRIVIVPNGKSFFVQFATLIFGVLSFLMRQTNIVWINYFVVLRLLKDESNTKKSLALFIRDTLKNLFVIALEHWYMVVLDISFVIYLIINGGVVLGDKGHHSICFHPA
jgi:alpha-1,2-glucosyltransferase